MSRRLVIHLQAMVYRKQSKVVHQRSFQKKGLIISHLALFVGWSGTQNLVDQLKIMITTKQETRNKNNLMLDGSCSVKMCRNRDNHKIFIFDIETEAKPKDTFQSYWFLQLCGRNRKWQMGVMIPWSLFHRQQQRWLFPDTLVPGPGKVTGVMDWERHCPLKRSHRANKYLLHRK